MKKWLAGVTATVISAVIVWWITNPPPAISLDGFWKYTLTSKSGNTNRGSLRLTMSGSQVTGIPENTFDKTKRVTSRDKIITVSS